MKSLEVGSVFEQISVEMDNIHNSVHVVQIDALSDEICLIPTNNCANIVYNERIVHNQSTIIKLSK